MKYATVLSVLFMASLSSTAQFNWQVETVLPSVHSGNGFHQVFGLDINSAGEMLCSTSEGIFIKQSGNWTAVPSPFFFGLPASKIYADLNGGFWALGIYGETYYYLNGIWNPYGLPVVDITRDELNRVWAFRDSTSNSTGIVNCLTDPSAPIIAIGFGSIPGLESFFKVYDATAYIGLVNLIFRYSTSGLIASDTLPYIISAGGLNAGTAMSSGGDLVMTASLDWSSDTMLVSVFDGNSFTMDTIPGIWFDNYLGIDLQLINNHLIFAAYSTLTADRVIVTYNIFSGDVQTVPIGFTPTYSTPYLPFSPLLFSVKDKIYVYDELMPAGLSTYFIVTNPFATNIITGIVFIDHNSNGQLDASDSVLPNQLIHQAPQNNFAASNEFGLYSLFLSDTAGTYYITLQLPNNNWQFTTSSIQTVIQTFEGDTSSSVNFGLSPLISVTDVSVAGNSSPARPGMETTHFIQVTNNGTLPYDGQLDVTLHDNYTFESSTWNSTGNNANTFSFDVPTLQPFGAAQLQIVGTLATTASPGDSVYTTANVIASNDINPANNQVTFSKIITASYDPNEKTVTPAGFGSNHVTPAGTKLNYTVFFQNTGTDTAFTVIIRDTMATEFLDMTTFKVLGYSHSMNLEVNGPGNVAFVFNNILLPDSNVNEPLSHGFVQYEIDVKDNAPNGSFVKNTAHIYFDYNAPIVTNTTVNVIGIPTLIREISVPSVSSVPNPASVYITVQSTSAIESITVFNSLGQPVLKANALVGNKLNVASLPAGHYTLQASTASERIHSQFIKH